MIPSDRKPIVIDMDSPGVSELDFQDFSSTSGTHNYDSGFSPAPPSKVTNIIPDSEVMQKLPVWSWDYFQKFFDVDTETVLNRIKGSLLPAPGVNYLQHHIASKPDLYGPFWICVTLVFTIGISGNMANYLQSAALHKYHWRYNFHAVTGAATAIFLYAWLLPLLWWSVLKLQGNDKLTLLELICVYGYSLCIYIPVSVLWVIQINFLQWLLVIFGTAISGYVLVTSVQPAFGSRNYFFILVIICLKVLLAVGFMMYFFHVPPMTTD